jgi:beta-galactosidase
MLLAPAPFSDSAPAEIPADTGSRERLSFDESWRFHLGDIPFPEIKGHGMTYDSAKAGNATGAAAPAYDDTSWRLVNLPHDWVVEGPFDKNANLSQGYRPRGVAWYRRSFRLPESDRGRHLEVRFDGVSTHCTVWLNGTVVHRNWCGYTSFSIDITPFAKYGDELNTLAVRVDAVPQEGWWYEGGGLYRHAWLVKRAPVHLITDGVCAQPVRQEDKKTWKLPVGATLYNSGSEDAMVEVVSTLLGPDGRPLAEARGSTLVVQLEQAVVHLEMTVTDPQLWSVDDPRLHKVSTVVRRNGGVVDGATTPCGFRTFRWDPNDGFFLNDKALKLYGTCNHQDHAGVGVAVPDAIWDFRVRKLREMGSNAYRCAHNPPAAEFLEACDRQGMLVMDENRNFNSSPEYIRQLEWMVRRDRNHPSVFLWSVFNEEPQQGTEIGYEMVRRMVAAVKKLDGTRPVTAAMNGGLLEPVNVSHAVDVVGFNYSTNICDEFHRTNPDKPTTSSEDTSAFMTRGEFVTDAERNLMGSYDTEHAGWGATHRKAWENNAKRPWLGGGFVWTGFDYRGEPSPWIWPSASSFFGCMDLCGFPKTAFYLHQAQWIKDRPILHLVPHWNWPGREGRNIRVMALSNAEKVGLFLNGKSLGEKPVDIYEMVEWEIPYEPGRLEAVGKSGGREVSRFAVETTGDPVALELIPDRPTMSGDGRDAIPVTVRALDEKGRPVPTADRMVGFQIGGPGEIIGVGNGDPNCHEPEKANQRSLFHGLAQVIVQSGKSPGDIVLRASADGLKPAECRVKVGPAPAVPSVPQAMPTLSLTQWRQSPSSATRPDPNQAIPENDMNSWIPVTPGKITPFTCGDFAIFRTKFQPHAAQRREGGRIVFREIVGKAEAWLDNVKAGEKPDFASGPLTVNLPSGNAGRTLSVLIEAQPGKPSGLAAPVILEPNPLE